METGGGQPPPTPGVPHAEIAVIACALAILILAAVARH